MVLGSYAKGKLITGIETVDTKGIVVSQAGKTITSIAGLKTRNLIVLGTLPAIRGGWPPQFAYSIIFRCFCKSEEITLPATPLLPHHPHPPIPS
jgi:hypothetical protein